MNVSESKDHEESDHLEEEVNGETHANENDGEVKAKKKKKKNKKKSTTATAVANDEDTNHVGDELVRARGELGQEEKDDEDAAEGNLINPFLLTLAISL